MLLDDNTRSPVAKPVKTYIILHRDAQMWSPTPPAVPQILRRTIITCSVRWHIFWTVSSSADIKSSNASRDEYFYRNEHNKVAFLYKKKQQEFSCAPNVFSTDLRQFSSWIPVWAFSRRQYALDKHLNGMVVLVSWSRLSAHHRRTTYLRWELSPIFCVDPYFRR